jgi:hypothetical protein
MGRTVTKRPGVLQPAGSVTQGEARQPVDDWNLPKRLCWRTSRCSRQTHAPTVNHDGARLPAKPRAKTAAGRPAGRTRWAHGPSNARRPGGGPIEIELKRQF